MARVLYRLGHCGVGLVVFGSLLCLRLLCGLLVLFLCGCGWFVLLDWYGGLVLIVCGLLVFARLVCFGSLLCLGLWLATADSGFWVLLLGCLQRFLWFWLLAGDDWLSGAVVADLGFSVVVLRCCGFCCLVFGLAWFLLIWLA